MDPPYRIIADNLRRGSVIPFLGAGASQSARGKEKWTAGCGFFPLGRELALHLAEHANFPKQEPKHARENLAYVASFFAKIQTNRGDLDLLLRSIFTERVAPGRLHDRLAANEKPLLIMTTNYDDLLEQAFDNVNKHYHLIISHNQMILHREPGQADFKEPEDPSRLKVFLESSEDSIIYKMHGSIDRKAEERDFFIITEEDYVDVLADRSAIPACFFEAMRAKEAKFLFLGYGLQDWNFRVMLRKLRDTTHASMGRSWAFQYQVSPVEKELWKRQDVNNYELKKLGLTFDSFADLL